MALQPYRPDFGQPSGRGGNLRPLVDRRRNEAIRLPLAGGGFTHLWDAIASAVDCGLGVLIARTSDGGAVSLTVYEGNDRSRTYCSNEDELNDAVLAIQDLVGEKQLGLAGVPSKAPASQRS